MFPMMVRLDGRATLGAGDGKVWGSVEREEGSTDKCEATEAKCDAGMAVVRKVAGVDGNGEWAVKRETAGADSNVRGAGMLVACWDKAGTPVKDSLRASIRL